MKKCFKCNKVKPLIDFYKHKEMKDGRLNKCKECTKKDSFNHRWKNIEKVREYDRNRGNRQGSAYIRSFRERYPKKYKAHSAVASALKSGKLIKPEKCDSCGCFHTQIEGHHQDYNKPLDVSWLCSPCHKQWHRDNGEAKNAT